MVVGLTFFCRYLILATIGIYSSQIITFQIATQMSFLAGPRQRRRTRGQTLFGVSNWNIHSSVIKTPIRKCSIFINIKCCIIQVLDINYMADLNDRGAVNLTSTSVSTSANELAMLQVSATGDDNRKVKLDMVRLVGTGVCHSPSLSTNMMSSVPTCIQSTCILRCRLQVCVLQPVNWPLSG